jgi:hypothetical protein
MMNRIFNPLVRVTLFMTMLSLPGFTSLVHADPLTPALAARREMVRNQREQRITPEKRRKAVEALKAERMRVYQAKQLVNRSNSGKSENN